MRRPPRSIARPRLLVAAALASAGAISCGASIQALYEGDVRFEHCMALDARPDVKPTLSRACWDEWLSFYTYGQTRDRIDYARLRAKQLGAASDFDEGEIAPTRAAPDPTSAIAPPPMMFAMADAGTSDAGPPEERDVRQVAYTKCTGDCDQQRDSCRQVCKATPACERACAAHHVRCEARCAARRQGSR
jgi:hypothetical protein